ncbi:MAG: phosphatase PAP2 family protein [Lentimicrobium sp.]|nr:phosphatase PAP2 family protein [Lentimicrobium sp.]
MNNIFKTNIFKIISTILLLFCLSNTIAQNFDIDLLRDINLNRNKSLDPTFRAITNSALPISIATPIIIYSVGLIKKDGTVKRKAVFIAETVLVSGFISAVLKYSVNKDRPYVTYPDIEQAISATGPSFPSGHTSAAFATATSLSIAFPKWYVIAPSFVWAGAVGYSRMDLGVHYPSDVLVGAIVGSGSAYLTYKLNKWINNKKQKNILFDGTN